MRPNLNNLNLKRLDFPADVVVEPVAYCNLSCAHCPQKHVTRPQGVMSERVFDPLADEVSRHKGTRMWFGFMGEPFLRPHNTKKLISTAIELGCDVHVSTNGLMLTEADAAWLMEQKISEVIIGQYSLASAEAAKKLLRFRLPGDPRVVVQYIDEGDFNHTRALDWNEKGAVVKRRLKAGWGGAVPTPAAEGIERNFPCPWLTRCAIVLWNGRFAMCDGDWDGKHSIAARSIRDAWNVGAHADVREAHWNGNFSHPICAKCDDWAVGRAQWFYPSDSDRRPQDG